MGMRRRQRRRRVLAAGAATAAVAHHEGKKHAEQDQAADEPEQSDQYDEPEQDAADDAPEPAADTGPDAGDLDEIQKLAELHDSGALTDEEFSAAKAKLLA